MKRIVVIYQVLQHYREAVFRRLCQENHNVEYTLFSDPANTIDSVKTIDPEKANIPVAKGGLRWRFVKNRLIGNLLWQRGVIRLAFNKEYDGMIFLGNVKYISTWVCCILAHRMGKNTFMWTHGFLKDEKGFKAFCRKYFYKLADGILLYHNRAREIMIHKGFNPDKLYVIYNSLDYKKQSILRDRISKGQLQQKRNELFSSCCGNDFL